MKIRHHVVPKYQIRQIAKGLREEVGGELFDNDGTAITSLSCVCDMTLCMLTLLHIRNIYIFPSNINHL